MEELTVMDIILSLCGSGGIIYIIINYFLKHRDKGLENKEAEKVETKEKIKELNKKIDELSDERFQLSIKLARLEERILIHAKDKVKKRRTRDEDHDDDHLLLD